MVVIKTSYQPFYRRGNPDFKVATCTNGSIRVVDGEAKIGSPFFLNVFFFFFSVLFAFGCIL